MKTIWILGLTALLFQSCKTKSGATEDSSDLAATGNGNSANSYSTNVRGKATEVTLSIASKAVSGGPANFNRTFFNDTIVKWNIKDNVSSWTPTGGLNEYVHRNGQTESSTFHVWTPGTYAYDFLVEVFLINDVAFRDRISAQLRATENTHDAQSAAIVDGCPIGNHRDLIAHVTNKYVEENYDEYICLRKK